MYQAKRTVVAADETTGSAISDAVAAKPATAPANRPIKVLLFISISSSDKARPVLGDIHVINKLSRASADEPALAAPGMD